MAAVSCYRAGTHLVIEDAGFATRHISMAEDLEEGMTVRVTHNFETFLVCEPATVSEATTVEQFPPRDSDDAGLERAGCGASTCR